MADSAPTTSFEIGDDFAALGDFDTAPDNGTSTPVCAKPNCFEHVTKPARGRTPKFCDEHKATGPGSKPGAEMPKKSAGSWAQANAVENALNQLFSYAGMGLTLVNPADANAVITGGPAVSAALVELARSDKKLRGYLEMLAAPGKYGALAMAVLGIVIPILVNHGVIKELSFFSAPSN
jgi:hypothetical protein